LWNLSHSDVYVATPSAGAAASFGKEAPTLTLDQRDFLPPAAKDNADTEGDEASSW
jgi:hypothetical protein